MPNLYSFLRYPKQDVDKMIGDLGKYYTSLAKAKKKHGVYQFKDNIIKYRCLDMPNYYLKKIQSRIHRLLSNIPMPSYMHGSVNNSNNIIHAIQHTNHKYFLKIDLKDFFPKISNTQVFNLFLENNFSVSVSSCLTKLTTYNHALPQGAPTSPLLSNMVFRKTADKLHLLALKNEITFTTYFDDLIFSSNNSFENLISQFLDIIRQGYFHISHKKIKYRKDLCEITGVIVCKNSIYAPYKVRQRAKSNKYVFAYVRQIERYNAALINKMNGAMSEGRMENSKWCKLRSLYGWAPAESV